MKKLIAFLEKRNFIDEATSLRNGATELKLSYIWDESVIEIAKILRTDNTLTYFELEESLIEHTGVEAIIQALQMNYTITNCTIFLADNYVEIVGGEYAYEERVYEDIDQIEPLINRNKEYVKKLSLFINSLFSNDNENIPFSIKNFMVLNFYSIADKQLLKKYLIEQQVNDVETKLQKVDYFIKSHMLTFSSTYKNINLSDEIKIFRFPDENEKALDEINNIEEVEVTGNSYCILS